ncbi:hypothetical protein TNIN_77251, partial [Trichonephila inaurata madagascariensis]
EGFRVEFINYRLYSLEVKEEKEDLSFPFSSLKSLKMKIDGETEYRLYLTPETDSDAELRRRYFEHCFSKEGEMDMEFNCRIRIDDSLLLRSPLTYDAKLEELLTPNQATQYITLNRFQWSDFILKVPKNTEEPKHGNGISKYISPLIWKEHTRTIDWTNFLRKADIRRFTLIVQGYDNMIASLKHSNAQDEHDPTFVEMIKQRAHYENRLEKVVSEFGNLPYCDTPGYPIHETPVKTLPTKRKDEDGFTSPPPSKTSKTNVSYQENLKLNLANCFKNLKS